MHVVCVNYTYNPLLTAPEDLLARYRTLTAWAESIRSMGAAVSVVQRFGADIEVTHNGIVYRFVRARSRKHGGLMDRPRRLHNLIEELQPDVVHVNGLQFARQAWQLKRQLKRPVLLQDHANSLPQHWLNRWTLRRALRQIDAVSFVSREQATPWQIRGSLNQASIVELMEGSSRFRLQSRETARARTGVCGDPLCLWVGRLNANKDPIAVLRGFAKALPALPNGRLAMIFSTSDLLSAVHQWLADNPAAAGHVTLLGQQPHAALEALYNSADLFLLGSHHEGSGYAVLEALACGVVPVVTDIPSFRVLTGQGTTGGLWPVGDADALAAVLMDRYSRLSAGSRGEVRAFFDANFSWEAIASRALAVYRELVMNAESRAREGTRIVL